MKPVVGGLCMDIKGLQYFIAAAEKLNFTSAARECHITQTAMSLHISKMEDNLGFQLFNRGKRGVELTGAGNHFYHQALSIVRLYETAVHNGLEIAAGAEGILRVLVLSSAEGFVFKKQLRTFRERHPKVNLSVLVRDSSQMVSSLKNGDIDIAIGPPEDMECEPDISVIPLREDPAIAVCSERHPFAALEKVTAEHLKNERVIVYEPKDLPNTINAMRNDWMQLGLLPGEVLYGNNLEEIILMAELGQGIGILPGYVGGRIRPGTDNGPVCIELSGIDGVSISRTALCYLKENRNPAVKNLLEIFTSKEL